MSDSFLIDQDGGTLFAGPRIVTIPGEGYACIRLSPGQHNLSLTSETGCMVVVVPSSEEASET
jgi:hypothetical protein